MDIKVILIVINFFILFVLVVQPVLDLRKQSSERDRLKIEIEKLKEIVFEKQKELRKQRDEYIELTLKNSIEKNEKKEFIFKSEFEMYKLLDKLSKSNNINIELLGREAKKIDEFGNIENILFFHSAGKEFDIYNFIFQMEKEDRYIALKEDGVLIEINGDIVDLKVNIVYINNNKKEKLDYKSYGEEIFKKVKSRDIGKKRRAI